MRKLHVNVRYVSWQVCKEKKRKETPACFPGHVLQALSHFSVFCISRKKEMLFSLRLVL